MLLQILSGLAIIFLSSSGIFQIAKLYKEKSAKDISFIMALLWSLGCAIFFVRSIIIKDIVFTLNYGLNTIICLTIVVQIIYYRWLTKQIQ